MDTEFLKDGTTIVEYQMISYVGDCEFPHRIWSEFDNFKFLKTLTDFRVKYPEVDFKIIKVTTTKEEINL